MGYNISEIKNTSTLELKNILNLIYFYFTKRSRQKTKNSNFKNLYYRIKKELIERESKNDINKKNSKFKIPSFNYTQIIKSTPIENIKIPDFFNDKQFRKNSFIKYPYNSFSTENFDEEYLREEFEKIKQKNVALLYEMYAISSSNEIQKEQNNRFEYNLYSQFNINKNKDFNFDILSKLYENSENNFICNNEEKLDKKIFENDNYFFQKI